MKKDIYVRILTCNNVEIDRSWNFPDMLCTYWRLYLNSDEGAFLKFEDAQYPLRKGRIYLIPPWQTISLYNKTLLRHFYAHFDIIGLTEFMCGKLFPPIMEFESLKFEALKDLAEKYQKGEFENFTIACRLKSLIYGLLGDYFERSEVDLKQTFERLMPVAGIYSEVFEYIESHLSDKIDNSQLADIHRQSPSHFIRDFKKAVSITPAKFVTQRRIAKAIELLVFTDRTIEKIAADTGFSDRFHFSKAFKRYTATTPAQYRKALK